MRKTSTLIILLFLGGCLEGSDSPAPKILIDGNGIHCSSTVTSCPRAIIDGDTMKLDGLELRAQTTKSAVVVEWLGTVELRNASISTHGPGIVWEPPGGSCDSCGFSLIDSTIESHQSALMARVPGGSLLIQRSVLATYGDAPTTGEEDNQADAVWTHSALNMVGVRHAVIVDTQIQSTRPDPGVGLWITGGGIVNMTQTSIAGFWQAMSGDMEQVGPGPVQVECQQDGVEARSPGSLELGGFRIHGCRGVAMDLDRPDRLTLQDIIISNSSTGLRVVNSMETTLTGFILRDNGYAAILAGGIGESARLSDGTVEGNLYVGVSTAHSILHVDNVGFDSNGLGWPDPGAEPEAWRYGALLIDSGASDPRTDLVVTSSDFAGNSPYALRNLGGNAVDARDNWWDDKAGPTHEPWPIPTTIPGGPEVVYGPVLTAPWRTQP